MLNLLHGTFWFWNFNSLKSSVRMLSLKRLSIIWVIEFIIGLSSHLFNLLLFKLNLLSSHLKRFCQHIRFRFISFWFSRGFRSCGLFCAFIENNGINLLLRSHTWSVSSLWITFYSTKPGFMSDILKYKTVDTIKVI